MTTAAKKPQQALTVATPADLLNIAVEQGADLDKLEKLMDLQDRWEKTEAKKAFINAMAAFNDEPLVIEKTRKAHNAMYAGLAETLEIVRPALQKHGLNHSWKTTQHETGTITVQCCITHILGHSECTQMTGAPDTSGSKNSIQALGSTQSYLQRYSLYAILGLASTDQDRDGNNEEVYITDKQVAELNERLDKTESDKAQFCKAMGINSIPELPLKKFGRAISLVERKEK
jgi:hypothetical protein